MDTPALAVTLNGERREFPAGSCVADVLAHLELPPGRAAVEINRQIVPRSLQAGRLLREGDRIEIVTFVGGG